MLQLILFTLDTVSRLTILMPIMTSSGRNSRILFFNFTDAFANNSTKNGYYTGQDVTCKANASRQLACSYRWYKDITTEVSSHPTFTPNGPGLYKCQAQCPMRADSCILTAMMINVTGEIIDVSTSPVLGKLRKYINPSLNH